ncbi:MAG: hypothetical protein ACOVT5_15030, partial [Armatimonadaceae bacterium]
FKGYAAKQNVTIPPGVLEGLLERYAAEGRELRACEPRDLIERSRDICRFRAKPLELTPEILSVAWSGYFGAQQPKKTGSAAEASGIKIDNLGHAAM